jgi:hypothetical protein
MGAELPRRCLACKNCKKCQFCMDSRSLKDTEYKKILSKRKLDEERKEWVAAYLFNTFVGKLINNYFQQEGA